MAAWLSMGMRRAWCWLQKAHSRKANWSLGVQPIMLAMATLRTWPFWERSLALTCKSSS